MNKKIIASSSILIVFGILAKISGFFREITLAYYYGAGTITDAYLTATIATSTIFGGLTLATGVAFIPVVMNLKQREVNLVTSNVTNIITLLIVTISVLTIFFTEEFARFFAVGFDKESIQMTSSMIMIILPFYFTYAIGNVFSCYLQSQNIFIFVGVIAVLSNFINILFFAISNNNTNILAGGFVLSLAIPALITYIWATKKGFIYTAVFNLKDSYIKELAKMSFPIFMGNLVLQLNTIVDRNFASILGTGIVSAMQYANKLNTFFITLFVISIATAIFPTLSQQANDDLPALKKTASGANNIILLFAIPVTVAILLLGNSIVELIFMRGAFSQESADITANALRIYALGLPALSLAEILNREFYALKDTKAPVVCSVVSISTNIILNFLLVKEFGYMGLALSTSIAAMVLALLLFYKLHKKIGEIGLQHLLVNCSKMILAAIGMGIIVYFLDIRMVRVLPAVSTMNRVIALAVTSIVGAGVYGILVYLLRIREVRTVIGLLKEKLLQRIV